MQTIIVDMTPGFRMPTIYYSQGDVGTQFAIDLRSRFGDSFPTGTTVTIQATKPSGFGFSVSADSTTGGLCVFTTTAEMTDEFGRFPAELKVTKTGLTLFSANFYMDGEENTHPDGTIDGQQETVIPELAQLVERVEDAASSVLDMTVNATTLAAGSQATYSYDEETNTATFGIPKGADGSLASGVLAPTYSSSSTYAVGDYVYYSGSLYRCTTAITTAEAWTSGHWTQVALAPEVSDLKSELKDTQDYTLLKKDRVIAGTSAGQKLNDSGTLDADANYNTYKYSVTAGDIIYLVSDYRYQFQTVMSSGSPYTRVGNTEGVFEGYIIVPETAAFIAISTPASGGTGTMKNFYTAQQIIDMLNANISGIWLSSTAYTGNLNDAPNGYTKYLASAANAPSVENGFLITLHRFDSNKCQIAFTDSKGLYIRTLINSTTWGSWSRKAEYTDCVGFYDITNISWGKRINDNVAVGTTLESLTPTTAGGWGCQLIRCIQGEVYKITSTGGVAAKAYAFVDDTLKVLEIASTTAYTDAELTAPQNGYLILNFNYSFTAVVSKRKNAVALLSELLTEKIPTYDKTAENQILYNYANDMEKGIVYPYGSGTVVKTTTPDYRAVKIPCAEGDIFVFNGKAAGGMYKLWMVLNASDQVIMYSGDREAASNNLYPIERTVVIPENGASIVVNCLETYTEPYVYKKDNLKKLLSVEETAKAHNKYRFLFGQAMPDIYTHVDSVPNDPTTWLSVNDIYAAYDALMTAYPNNITKTDMGWDQSNTYHIYRYEFKPDFPDLFYGTAQYYPYYTADSFPVVMLDAGCHGNERPAVLALLNFMSLVYSADSNTPWSWLKNNIHFVVTPIVNPWGYTNGYRWNSRHVNLNRNFTPYWANGSDDPTSADYRGTEALSEKEAQYVNTTLIDFAEKTLFYYSYHTLGEFTGYSRNTDYMVGEVKTDALMNIAFSTVQAITNNGWEYHDLPLDSGYIGYIDNSNTKVGTTMAQANYKGIVAAIPEVLYKYYDSENPYDISDSEIYKTKYACMNVEYMLFAVMFACQTLLSE